MGVVPRVRRLPLVCARQSQASPRVAGEEIPDPWNKQVLGLRFHGIRPPAREATPEVPGDMTLPSGLHRFSLETQTLSSAGMPHAVGQSLAWSSQLLPQPCLFFLGSLCLGLSSSISIHLS